MVRPLTHLLGTDAGEAPEEMETLPKDMGGGGGEEEEDEEEYGEEGEEEYDEEPRVEEEWRSMTKVDE